MTVPSGVGREKQKRWDEKNAEKLRELRRGYMQRLRERKKRDEEAEGEVGEAAEKAKK